MDGIELRVNAPLDLDAVIDVYRACSLGGRRPVDDRERMRAMLSNANLVVSAHEGSRLVGLARSLTDFAYVAYLSDLLVRESHQKRGLGRAMIACTQEAIDPRASIVLLAAPLAVDYYPRIGFTRHDSAWVLPPGHRVRG